MKPERRFTRAAHPVRVQTRADGARQIEGYAAVYYDGTPETEYQLWDDITERIMPGAFDRAAREDDVRALFNHNPELILGRTKPGTLRLQLDSKGLRYEIDPPDSQTGRDVLVSLERGDVDGSSFAFMPTETTWREQSDDAGKRTWIREIRAVQLYDVGPVTYPAYAATTSGVRSDADAAEARRALEEHLAAEAHRRHASPAAAEARRRRARAVQIGAAI